MDEDDELEKLMATMDLTIPTEEPAPAKIDKPKDVSYDDVISMQNIWKLPNTSIQAALDASQIYKSKHGMFAGVPILCKNANCPYVLVCMIPHNQRVTGGRCPMEAGAVMARFESWCKHFNIDLTGVSIRDEDLVDASLIRDLVDNEIQMLRAENRIAISSDFIGLTISQIDNKGNPYYEETVTPAAEYKLALQDKRYKIMNLLNSTRKDKDKLLSKEFNPSLQASSILKKVADMLPIDIDSVNFEEASIVEENINKKDEAF